MDIEPLADVVEEPPPPPAPVMDIILTWIGFDQEATRNRLQAEGFESFSDVLAMKEKDVRDLAESYGRRTVADGRAIFGLRKIRYLIGLIHWVQDYQRIGEEPTIVGIHNAAQFRTALDEAYERADVRKVEKDQSDTVSKAADPGKFKDERKWSEWEPAFVNYLSTIHGVNGIPLCYVIRELENAIACAPLAGSNFQADARKVHQLLKSYLQAESAEQWIKPIARHQDGRRDMEALRKHYSGEGNTSRRIAVAERYRDTLHYKNEKALLVLNLSWIKSKLCSTYLRRKVSLSRNRPRFRMLLKKVEHPQLQTAVGTLRVRAQMDGVSFTECANHLSAIVSELPDYQLNRKVSATTDVEGQNQADARWWSRRRLPRVQSVKASTCLMGPFGPGTTPIGRRCQMRISRLSWKPGKRIRQRASTPTKRKVSDVKAQLAELKKSIAAIKLNKLSKDDDTSATDDSSIPDNAGDSFGGRNKKKATKGLTPCDRLHSSN